MKPLKLLSTIIVLLQSVNILICQTTPPPVLAQSIFIFEERKPQSKDGEVICDSGYYTRKLNFIAYPFQTQPTDLVRLNSTNNQITLEPGLYLITASAPAWRSNNHKLLIRDLNNRILLAGTNSTSYQLGRYAVTNALLTGVLRIATTTTVKLDHYIRLPLDCKGKDSSTLGIAIGKIKDQGEIYAQMMVQRIGGME